MTEPTGPATSVQVDIPVQKFTTDQLRELELELPTPNDDFPSHCATLCCPRCETGIGRLLVPGAKRHEGPVIWGIRFDG